MMMKLMMISTILSLLVLSAQAQTDSRMLSDLAYALESPANREEVLAAMQQFQHNTQVALLVHAEFEQDVYGSYNQPQLTTWLQEQTHGITVLITLAEGTKAFRQCQLQVSEAVEALLPLEDRALIRTGLMEFYFRSSPIPTDAYTQGLLAGIEAMEKKILENRANEKEELPDEVVRITHVDEAFAAGIDNDKLKIEYAIQKEYVSKLKAAKLEVYKNMAKEPCFVTALNTEEAGTYLWDGKLSEKEGDYIAYKDSPFTIKITVSEDEEFEKVGADEEEGWVDKEADEFRLYADFAKKHVGGNRPAWTTYQYYKKIRPQVEDNIISKNPKLLQLSYNENPLKYYTENIVDTEFIGRTFKAHISFQPILERIEDIMGKPNGASYTKYKSSKKYGIGGFVIRFQNDVDRISDHSFGMAIDIDAIYNPQLYKKKLGFVSLLSNYNMVWQKGSTTLTVENMKRASDCIKELKITNKSLTQMKVSLLAIDQYNQIKDVYKIQDLVTGTVAEDFNVHFNSFNKLHQRASYLSNERHFLDNPSRYSQQEAANLEQEFYEDIPEKCQAMQASLTLFEKKLDSLHKVFLNHYKYAFFLHENFKEQYNYIENHLRETVEQTQKIAEALSDLEELVSRKNIPSCFSCEVSKVKGKVTYNEQLAIDLYSFLAWTEDNNEYLHGEKSLGAFASWIASKQSYLTGLCERGFFRIDNKFVHYFLDQEEITWGGFFKNRNDWMHFEISDEYKQF